MSHEESSTTDSKQTDEGDPYPALDDGVYSLSRYFPIGTVYFYAFPAGEDSGFFNNIPAWVEELVAARPLLCAGDHVRVLTFDSVYTENILRLLSEMGVEPLDSSRVIVLPKAISSDLAGKERNDAIKSAIKHIKCERNLVMAQPFLDEDLKNAYQIPPEVSVWLNDKENMSEYIPAQHLPLEYAHFYSGKDFFSNEEVYPLPCVVKMTSSSAGDGVRICHTADDLKSAKDAFAKLSGHVIIYEFVQSVRNLCVQFGIPSDPSKKIDVIGFNEQVIGRCGEFLGGMVSSDVDSPELHDLFSLLQEDILPKVRAKGWHGVGGLDVLVTRDNEYYFIDPNFRMTATFVFVCQVRNKHMKKSLLGFSGIFKGTEADFRQKILPIAKLGTPEQLLDIASLSCKDGVYHFNGAIVFDKNVPKEKAAKLLMERGVESLTLSCICS